MNPESAARVGPLQQVAAVSGLGALLLTDAANVRNATGGYAADVLWSSPTRIVAAVIPRDGDPLLLAPDFVAVEARAVSGWTRVETYGSLVEPPIAQLPPSSALPPASASSMAVRVGSACPSSPWRHCAAP